MVDTINSCLKLLKQRYTEVVLCYSPTYWILNDFHLWEEGFSFSFFFYTVYILCGNFGYSKHQEGTK